MYYHTRPEDRFDAHAAIGDDEARALMIVTALRSCQGTISELVRHSKELINLAAVELEKTKSLREQMMEIIAIAGYITDAKMHIARDYLEKNTRQACGIKADQKRVLADLTNDLKLDNLRWRPRKRSRRSGSRKQSDTSSGSSSGDMDLSSPGPSGFCQLNLVPDEETCKSSGEQPFMGVPVQVPNLVMSRLRTVAQVQHNEGGVLVGQSTDGHQLCVKSAMDVPVSHFMEVYEIAENSETIRAEVCTDFGPNFGEIANAFGVCLGPLIAI
ncbi:hypothetical protein ACJX0J_005888, partial [Zea mays]